MFPLNGRTMVAAIAFLIISGSTAQADDVTDSLNDALTKYISGQYTEAINSVNYAEQLITQKKGEALTQMFPKCRWRAGRRKK